MDFRAQHLGLSVICAAPTQKSERSVLMATAISVSLTVGRIPQRVLAVILGKTLNC